MASGQPTVFEMSASFGEETFPAIAHYAGLLQPEQTTKYTNYTIGCMEESARQKVTRFRVVPIEASPLKFVYFVLFVVILLHRPG